MRDFIKEPAWRPEDLGLPLPDCAHACSVCLPTWDSTIGYEEGRPDVVGALQCGYPRFLLNPLVTRLFACAEEEVAEAGESVVVFPNRKVAEQAVEYANGRAEGPYRVAEFRGLVAVVSRQEECRVLHDFWRHTGQMVSSRQAEDVLAGRDAPCPDPRHLTTLATVMECAEDDFFVYESGMAAIHACHRVASQARSEMPTLQVDFPYVDALKVQEQLGGGAEFLPDGSGEHLATALDRIRAGEFAGVFCEIPSNPLLRSIDLAALSQACRASATPLVVDDTVASHLNLAAFPHADVITTSLTKWVSGKGDVMAGGVRVNADSPLAGSLRSALMADNPGGCRLYARDLEVLAENSAGFPELIARANDSGEAIADFLAAHPAVESVWYPKFHGKDCYDRLLRPGGGYGGLIGFCLRDPSRAPAVYDALAWSKGPSLGTEFSLACAYTLLAHYQELDWAESCGVPRNLIRLSVGIEETDVLIASLATALEEGIRSGS